MNIQEAQRDLIEVARGEVEKMAKTEGYDKDELRAIWRAIPETVCSLTQEELSDALITYRWLTTAFAVTYTAPKAQEIEFGPYKVGEEIYMVKPARSSDRRFAYLITDKGHEYQGIAARFVKPENRIQNLEEAGMYGLSHGFCICCGKLLTDPHSVQFGIGPVCANKYF